MLPLPGGAGLSPLLNQGRRLSDFSQGGPCQRLELDQMVRLLLDVLSGLAALHADVEDGVAFVHGEVSPQTVFVADDGTARLIPVLRRHWMPKVLPLSNGYIAPELLLGDRGDPRADVFSIGVMLWEALAGAPLCPDPSLDGVLDRLLRSQPARLLPPARDGWTAGLCEVAERAIAVKCAQRFQTATELSDAIRAAWQARHTSPEAESWEDEVPTQVQLPVPVAPFASIEPLGPETPVAFVAPLCPVTPLSLVLNLEPETQDLLEPNAALLRALTMEIKRPPPRGAWLALSSVAAVAFVLALVLLTRGAKPGAATEASLAPVPGAAAGAPRAVVADPLAVIAVSRAVAAIPAPITCAPTAAPSAVPPAPRAAPTLPKAAPRRRGAQIRPVDYGI
jgi:serine/threonine-protein kinase